MKDYKIFEKLKGKNISEALSKAEKEEIWKSIKAKLYEKKRKNLPLMVLKIAAIIILFFGIGFLTKISLKEKEPIHSASNYSIPMIETWEGSPEIIYESQIQDVKVAFVVDSNIEW